jgi:hypothetical protein
MTTVTKALGALASLGACVGMPAAASANSFFPCYTEAEIGSAQVHEMRIALMVDALKCRDLVPAAMVSYGHLMAARDGDFRLHAGRVEGQLVERYGPRAGRIAFADYETMLGNHHSKGRYTVQTCRNLDGFLKLVERAANTDLRALSEVIPRSAIRACPAATYDAAEEVAVAGSVVRVHRGGEAMVPHGHAEPAVATRQEIEEDLAPLAERVAPVTPLAKVDPSAAQPAPNRADRLGDAIKALDSAAAALREMQGETPAGRP